MKITKRSVYTNRSNTMDVVNITEEQFECFQQSGDIDTCAPDLTYEEREFLLTGALPTELDTIDEAYDEFEDDDEDEDDWK